MASWIRSYNLCVQFSSSVSSELFSQVQVFLILNSSSPSRPTTPIATLFFLNKVQTQVFNLQAKVGLLLEQLHNESSEPKAVAKFLDQVLLITMSLDKLAGSISGLQQSNPPPGSNEISIVDECFQWTRGKRSQRRKNDK